MKEAMLDISFFQNTLDITNQVKLWMVYGIIHMDWSSSSSRHVVDTQIIQRKPFRFSDE